MAREIKVAEEQAEAEFIDWLEGMDIDPDTEGDKARVIKAIMHGDLVFNDDGLAVYTPWRSASGYREPLVFHERTGADLMAADAKAKLGPLRQMYATMGSLCRVDASVFSKLSGADIKTCEAVFGFLMA
jgi:hypothetical protein